MGTDRYGVVRTLAAVLTAATIRELTRVVGGVGLVAVWAASAASVKLCSHRTTARWIVTAASVPIRTHPYPSVPIRTYPYQFGGQV